jgi:class 3 adenylate cyclase/pimeloyl-ACP methyl ester carboxylesterase
VRIVHIDIRYANSDGVQIAYSMLGKGSHVLLIVPGLISNIELNFETEEYVSWVNLLGQHMQVIVYDKRGQGLSDRVADAPGPEQRMDDITAIAEAEQLDSFFLLGFSEGAATALLYAATFPKRVRKVCVFGGFARFCNNDDYHHMFDEAVIRKSIDYWGSGASGFSFIPDLMPERQDSMARFERACCTPNGYRALLETNFQIDVRSILKEVKVPALVIHRRDDKAVPVGNGRYLADHMPGADYVEFAMGGHVCWMGDQDSVASEIIHFLLQRSSQQTVVGSYLATVLFTDIVGSSAKLTEVGDAEWRHLLNRHDQLIRIEVEKFSGRFVKSTGDGVLAIFDGPARAIRCALGLHHAIADLAIDIRIGMHVGEVQSRGDDISGMALHVAARVVDQAKSGEVVITRTLNDLIAGSGLKSKQIGEYQLKGMPESWTLYQAALQK